MTEKTTLLTTKLHIPLVRPGTVTRPRLTEALDEGLRLGRQLSLVSAPAGFGKTTLIAAWLGDGGGGAANESVAWLTLDAEDDDETRFFAYLIAALRQVKPDVGEAAESVLGTPLAPPPATLIALLINDLAELAEPFMLVLDDYQYIRRAGIHDAIASLLDHQPERMHLVIASRCDPPFPLARLRIRGVMTELRADDLRFTGKETAAFMNRTLPSALDADGIAALEAKTEGWIAALQFASLSMLGGKDIAALVRDFSAGNRHLIDYLAEEVLAHQPEEIRDFLDRTSILDRFCASLCDAVRRAPLDDGAAGSRTTASFESQILLERLERSDLFLVPLDDRREWYRYHGLFAEFLRSRLKRDQTGPLHLAAARWLEGRGLSAEAVRHALAHYEATGEAEEAVRIVTAAGIRALAEGALVTLLGWLDALPDEIVRADGWLASYKAWCLVMTGKVDRAESYIRSVERGLPPDASPVDRGRLLSLRCSVSDAAYVLKTAPRALELIGDADPFSRTGMLFVLGDAQDDSGDVVGAEKTFREAHELATEHGHLVMSAVALAHQAISMNHQGRREEALGLCRRGIAKYADSRGNPLPIAALLLVATGELAYEANDLQGARRHLETGIELGKRSATTRVVLYGLEELALTLRAEGDDRTALATVREAQELAGEAGEEGWRREGAAIEAAILLGQGDARAARKWAESLDLRLAEPIDRTRDWEYASYVRVLLESDRAKDARRILARLERTALEQGRRRRLITINLQQSIAAMQSLDESAALEYLERALAPAAREGYVRAFLDEAPRYTALLHRAGRAAPEFTSGLLRAIATEPRRRAPGPAVETLSDRELEVLRLLATDLPTPEIARRLFVSTSTVRSHVKSIYGKLGAHNRHEAITLARRLDPPR